MPPDPYFVHKLNSLCFVPRKGLPPSWTKSSNVPLVYSNASHLHRPLCTLKTTATLPVLNVQWSLGFKTISITIFRTLCISAERPVSHSPPLSKPPNYWSLLLNPGVPLSEQLFPRPQNHWVPPPKPPCFPPEPLCPTLRTILSCPQNHRGPSPKPPCLPLNHCVPLFKKLCPIPQNHWVPPPKLLCLPLTTVSLSKINCVPPPQPLSPSS